MTGKEYFLAYFHLRAAGYSTDKAKEITNDIKKKMKEEADENEKSNDYPGADGSC